MGRFEASAREGGKWTGRIIWGVCGCVREGDGGVMGWLWEGRGEVVRGAWVGYRGDDRGKLGRGRGARGRVWRGGT